MTEDCISPDAALEKAPLGLAVLAKLFFFQLLTILVTDAGIRGRHGETNNTMVLVLKSMHNGLNIPMGKHKVAEGPFCPQFFVFFGALAKKFLILMYVEYGFYIFYRYQTEL